MRNRYKAQRAVIPFWRRCAASRCALDSLKERLKHCSWVLSYVSIRDEFDTREINSWLAAEGKLVLPRAQGEKLALFEVIEPDKQLERGKWGIFEPTLVCKAIAPEAVAFTLVPGLAFDSARHRLGYGGGYYDRLLPELSGAYGLGFREQFCSTLLPVLPTDIALEGLLLY